MIPLTISNTGVSDLVYEVVHDKDFYEDFENGLDNWSLTGNWGLIPNSHNASTALTESPSGNYGDSWSQTIEMKNSLTVSNSDSCRLSYWLSRQMESCCDYLRTQIKVNDGSWQTLQSVNGTQSWNLRTINLSGYVKNGDVLNIRFYFTTDGSGTYDGVLIDDILISGVGSGANWLGLNTVAGNLATGNSNTYNVKLKSIGLNTGIYLDTIIVRSNDPLRSIDTIPCSLTVIGAPEISLSENCLSFDDVFIGASKIDTLEIYNTGCDTLKITNITSTFSDFTVDKTAFNILPGDTSIIKVRFAPESPTVFDGLITISNNDNDASICISGTGLEPPVLELSVNQLSATINSCGDSLTLPLTITNSGVSDLIFDVDNSSNKKTEILALTYGVDYYQEYPNTIAAINQYYTDYNLTEINTTLPAVLQSNLENKDILLIAEQESNTASVIAGFRTVIESFVNNGGTVIICGTVYQSCIFNTGLFSGSSASTISYGTLNVLDNSHAITHDFPSTINALSSTFLSNISNTDAVRLISYGNYDVLTYRNQGEGKAIFIAFDYYNYNNYSAQIIANAVKWGGKKTTADWLKVQMIADTLASGESESINVKFASAGLNSGVYNTLFYVNSNDPLKLVDSVQCTLILEGAPFIELSETDLNLGEIFAGARIFDTIQIYNTGCDTLKITSISSSIPEFVAEVSDYYVLPGDTGCVYIGFVPGSVQSYSGEITIFNNHINSVINVSGTGIEPPVFTISSLELNATTNRCDTQETLPLTITNSGLNDLSYEIVANNDFYDDFEHGLGKWNTAGSWGLTSSSYQGNYALTESPSGNYEDYWEQYIQIKNSLIVNNSSDCMLSYWLKREMEGCCDYIGAEISVNGGVWQFLDNYSGTYDWELISYNLDGFVNNGDVLNIRFYFRSDGSVNYDGASIDNVSVTGVGEHANWYSISNLAGTITSGASESLNITFNSANINDGDYTDSLIIRSNDPLAYENILVLNLTRTANSRPASANIDKTFLENTILQFTSDDFQFTDNDVCDTFKGIIISQINDKGNLFIDINNNNSFGYNERVGNNQFISKDELNLLRYKPGTNEFGNNYTSFSFQISDGDNYSANTYTVLINVTEDNVTGISNLFKGSFNLFPNPTTGSVTIELSNFNSSHIEIINLAGEKLYTNYQQNSNKIEVDLSGFNKGTYVIKVYDKKSFQSKKVILK